MAHGDFRRQLAVPGFDRDPGLLTGDSGLVHAWQDSIREQAIGCDDNDPSPGAAQVGDDGGAGTAVFVDEAA